MEKMEATTQRQPVNWNKNRAIRLFIHINLIMNIWIDWFVEMLSWQLLRCDLCLCSCVHVCLCVRLRMHGVWHRSGAIRPVYTWYNYINNTIALHCINLYSKKYFIYNANKQWMGGGGGKLRRNFHISLRLHRTVSYNESTIK